MDLLQNRHHLLLSHLLKVNKLEIRLEISNLSSSKNILMMIMKKYGAPLQSSSWKNSLKMSRTYLMFYLYDLQYFNCLG